MALSRTPLKLEGRAHELGLLAEVRWQRTLVEIEQESRSHNEGQLRQSLPWYRYGPIARVRRENQ
jgi:hypothetical protein